MAGCIESAVGPGCRVKESYADMSNRLCHYGLAYRYTFNYAFVISKELVSS